MSLMLSYSSQRVNFLQAGSGRLVVPLKCFSALFSNWMLGNTSHWEFFVVFKSKTRFYGQISLGCCIFFRDLKQTEDNLKNKVRSQSICRSAFPPAVILVFLSHLWNSWGLHTRASSRGSPRASASSWLKVVGSSFSWVLKRVPSPWCCMVN
jgi:hypothetical protein